MSNKFKVDLNASDRPERFTEEGDYTVVIQNVERQLTPKGDEKAVLTFSDDKNRTVKDDLLNRDTVYWRLNQLIIATGMPIPDGAELDFSKSGEFTNFVRKFVGMKLAITLKKDSFTTKEGEQKTFLKVNRYAKPAGSADQPF